MFSAPTVVIIGAGASAEVEMPVGEKLSKSIAAAAGSSVALIKADRGRGDVLASQLLNQSLDSTDIKRRIEALRAISSGVHLARSIDRFIDDHDHDPMIAQLGKVLIVQQILLSEGNSKLARARQGDGLNLRTAELDRTWFERFASIWLAHLKRTRVEDAGRNLSIVCFNYDRCLELFLSAALVEKYGLPKLEADRIVAGMEILHPYGTIGTLPGFGGQMRFGASVEDVNLWDAAARIKTFSERQDARDITDRIKAALSGAQIVIFLGFAYEQTNMQLLRIPSNQSTRYVYGTSYGLPRPSIKLIESNIRIALNSGAQLTDVTLDPLTCGEFVSQYGALWG